MNVLHEAILPYKQQLAWASLLSSFVKYVRFQGIEFGKFVVKSVGLRVNYL